MALKETLMLKNNLLSAASSLSLKAESGYSFMVKGLRSGALAAGMFTEVFIDRTSVGLFYTGDINANHLEQYSLAGGYHNVFAELVERGIHTGYPVAEGQEIELKPYSAGATVVAEIEYEVYDAEDITKDMPNGNEADEFVYLNYGTNKSVIAIDATGEIDMTRNPSIYPEFPYGKVVPAKTEIDIYGVLLQTWKDFPGNVNPNYAYLKMTDGRRVLWDEDRKGMCVREGMGRLTFGCIRQTVAVGMELFPEPITFLAGEELTVEMTAGDTAIAAQDILMCTIQKARRVS